MGLFIKTFCLNVAMIFVVEIVVIGKKKKKTLFLKCWENVWINGFTLVMILKSQHAYKASKQNIQCNEEKVPKQITLAEYN